MVEDLPRLMQEVFRVVPIDLKRSFGNWQDFAKIRIQDMNFHKEKGVSGFWIDQISSLVLC